MINRSAPVFIAGHRGMVGSAIVRRFQHAGFQSLVLRMRAELDLFDQRAVRDFFATIRPSYVIVAAARVGGIKANMTYPADFLYENLEIQNNVIWEAHRSGVEKLLFLGSSCIYPRECPQPMREEYLLNGKVEPTNEGYAIAKIAGLKLCEKIFDQYKQCFISCMPTNIYGSNDNIDPESSHVIPALMRRIHEAKLHGAPEVVVWGNGNSRREFLSVDDLADAVLWLMDHHDKRDFLNIGTGEDVSIRELAEELQRIIGYGGQLVFDATKPDGMPRKLLDVSNIHTLGWHHTTGLRDGLKKMYAWYQHVSR
jgi:GDP-L-fucose synthase